MAFTIKDNIIQLKKDCNKCIHFKVCKFHAEAKKLFKSDMFYTMTKYLEWNNNLRVFELESSCQFFELEYSIPDDGSLTLDIDEDIIREIVRHNLPANTTSFHVNIEGNLATFDSIGGEKLTLNLLEMIKNTGIKFATSK